MAIHKVNEEPHHGQESHTFHHSVVLLGEETKDTLEDTVIQFLKVDELGCHVDEDGVHADDLEIECPLVPPANLY